MTDKTIYVRKVAHLQVVVVVNLLKGWFFTGLCLYISMNVARADTLG